MLRARACYLVCAVMFLVTAAHDGPRVASAQPPSGFQLLGPRLVLSGSSVYFLEGAVGGSLYPTGWVHWADVPPVPTSMLSYFDGNSAITSAGEGWVETDPNLRTWVDVGNVAAPTAAHSTTFGQLRARYR